MSESQVNLDQMLKHVGEFGKFQFLLDAFFCFAAFPQTFPVLIMYFTAVSPSWSCVYNSTICNITGSIPKDNDLRCNIPRAEWQYDQPKSYSITTEFDLICKDKWLVDMTTSVLFLGWMTGAIVLGWIADNYGRKIVFFPAVTICIILQFAMSYTPNIIVILIIRFFIGCCIPGITANSFVMISEVVGAKYRSFAGMILFFFFTMALCFLSLKAYFIQEWRKLHLATSVPYIIVIFFYPFVPESVRWLQVHGKKEQLKKTFQRIAKWNEKVIPNNTSVEEKALEKGVKVTPFDLIKGRKMAISTLIQGYTWFVNGMVYYAISLAADDLGGSLYVNFVLVSSVQLPSVLSSIYCSERFGRKKTVITSLGMGSIACIVVAFTPETGNIKIMRLIFGMLGKFFISQSFNVIYTWSVELYPTNLRSQGMGFLQVTSRIGAATSPFIAKSLLTIYRSLPFLVMSIVTFLCFGLCFILPETKGKILQTLTDENVSQANKFHMEVKSNQVQPMTDTSSNL